MWRLVTTAYKDYRRTGCDSCRGYIGGPRLFCLDCIDKSNTFATLDLCCTPESRCIDAYVSSREELLPHEPSHKLVKLRIAVPTHHLGRAYKLAHAAFGRVETFLVKVMEASQPSRDEKVTEQDVSTQDPTTADQRSETRSDKLADKLDNVPTAANGTEGGVEAEPTGTKETSKNDNVPATTDDKIEPGENAPQTTRQAQFRDGDVPACGDCNRSLSFPFWYCIFCEGQCQ